MGNDALIKEKPVMWIGPMDPTIQWFRVRDMKPVNIPGSVWKTHSDFYSKGIDDK